MKLVWIGVQESCLIMIITHMLVHNVMIALVSFMRKSVRDRISLRLRLPLVRYYAPILHNLRVFLG